MRVECKYCKRNLTGKTIKMLKGEIQKVICTCSEAEARELRDKISKEFGLLTTHNDNK
tara:strand:- start:678 stop:851 length:174 start_codon:yes stop_codon:yes gene_type:complete